MAFVGMRAVGAFELAADLSKAAGGIQAASVGVIRHHGQMLQTRVKAHASGRPGPNVITGDYRRSIGLELRNVGLGVIMVEVGTNEPQGARLEWGFVGTDSAERSISQPPYPHFGPAVGETEGPLADAMLNLGVGLMVGGRRF